MSTATAVSAPSTPMDPLSAPFPSPFRTEKDSFSMERAPRSLLELAMARLSAAIRSKRDWRVKRHEPTILAKWQREAVQSEPLLTPAAIQYVLDELASYDLLLDLTSGIELSAVDGVWQSDTLLSTELLVQLKQAMVQCWGHESDEQRDWHPGSRQQVWDVLHPSLYCLVAGRTQLVAEAVPLQQSLQMIGGGRLLTVAEYGSELRRQLAALRVKGDRWGRYYAKEVDSDDEEAQQQRQQQEAAEAVERSPEEEAADANAAWQEGKIAVQVRCDGADHAAINITVHVKPDARLVDVKADIAARLPKSWSSAWSLARLDKQPLPEDETLPLYVLGIHSTTKLAASQEKVAKDKQAAAKTAKEKKAKAALQPVHITVQTQQGACISVHRLDQSATVQSLLQQLCDGTGKAKSGCYPSFARGVAPSEQRLHIDLFSWSKRLLPHRTFASYQLHNGRKVRLVWQRVTAAQREAEAATIELRVQPLRNSKLPAVMLDAERSATVGWLRNKLTTSLPGHSEWSKLPLSKCHVYFPSTSAAELSDDNATLSAVGMDGQQGEVGVGVRWEGDEKVKVAAEDEEEEKDGAAEARPADEPVNATPSSTATAASIVEAAPGSAAADEGRVEKEQREQTASVLDVAAGKQPADEQKADCTKEAVDADAETKLEVKLKKGGHRHQLQLNVRPSMTVRELKERIRDGQVGETSDALAKDKTLAVPVAEQQLEVSGSERLLNEARTLAFYDLCNGRRYVSWSRVELNSNSEQQQQQQEEDRTESDSGGTAQTSSGSVSVPRTIQLSFLLRYGGKRRADMWREREVVDCKADMTVGELRQQAAGWSMLGRHRQQRVDAVRVRRTVEGSELADELTLTEVGLTDGDTAVIDFFPMDVYVTLVLPSGTISSPFTLIADASTTVRELKQHIAARADGYPVEWQWAELAIERKRNRYDVMYIAASIDDDLPLSHYGVDADKGEILHMLVHRRQQPRHKQHNQHEAAEQPDQLLRLPVCVTASNDMYVVQAMAWQPLLAVKWQLVRMQAEYFDSQQLSLYPSTVTLSTASWRSPVSQLRPLTDDFASLQSLGVTDGRVLQLSKSEVPLELSLPRGVTWYTRPMEAQAHYDYTLHAQLDDTVQQLKTKLSTLTDMPAERTLFRFGRLLSAEVDDRLTLKQLGFKARGPRDTTVADSEADNELMLRVLPHPAAQPPTADQQYANELVQVGVRLLAASGRVHRVWLLRSETVKQVRSYLRRVLHSPLKLVDGRRKWDDASIALTVGGRTVDDGSAVAALLEGHLTELPLIDVLVCGVPKDDGDEDEMEFREEDEDVAAEADGQQEEPQEEAEEKQTEQQQHEEGKSERDKPSGEEGEVKHDAAAQRAQQEKPAAENSSESANGSRFCLHPQHLLLLMQPYKYSSAEREDGEWSCDICRRREEQTPDGKCWHCDECGYDVCRLCFDRANAAQSAEDAHGQVAEDKAADEQHPGTESEDDASGQQLGYHTSAKYAWLPTDFHVSDDGSVRCLSYINNLHPVRHAVMYPLIEQVVGRFVPLFERVLTSLRHPAPPKVPVGSWYDEAEEQRHEAEVAARQAELGDEFDEDDVYEQWYANRPIHQPLVPPFDPPASPPSVVSLRGRRLQLIVKLASIMLTPQQPRYDGGVWHVEGMRNECIVASGIAYYEQCNTGPSSLAFRCAVAEPAYEQNDDRGPPAVYGLSNGEALVQPLGAIDTCEGRCIAFPNVFQHRVAPFSLLDASKPGHRSILVLFLVDPTISILSTSRVPPQQKDWLPAAGGDSAVTDALAGARVLSELVDSYLDWPMSRAEAEQHREKLMHERKYFVEENTSTVYEREFSLCEH